jgi:6-phosphogluconolactonase
MPNIQRYLDHDVVSRAGAEFIVSAYERAINRHGYFSLVLSGGNTPKKMYELLADEYYSGQIDWSKVYIFWGDERAVPPTDEQNNYHMARIALLDKVNIPAENIHRIHSESSPAAAAVRYEDTLSKFFEAHEGNSEVRFDLVLLGIGPDAHMASLYPGNPALNEADRLVVEAYIPKLDAWRITLTPRAFHQSYEVLFVVSGHNKATAIKQVLEGPLAPYEYPAQFINPNETEVTWLLDEAAGRLLSEN